jgi:hypothetical protein
MYVNINMCICIFVFVPHIFIPLPDTTSSGAKEDNRETVKVASKEGDLS